MHGTMKSVLANLCKGHPTRWPQYLAEFQKILNSAVHEATGVQPHYAFFARHVPRQIGVTLPSIEEDPEIERAREIILQTNQESSKRWLNKANVGRRDDKLEKDRLVWVKKEVKDPGVNRKLCKKWLGPYKIIEVLREGSAYVVENTFDGVRIQRAAEKIKPYVGRDRILVQPEKIVDSTGSEDEDQLPPRQRRPVRRYIEEF